MHLDVIKMQMDLLESELLTDVYYLQLHPKHFRCISIHAPNDRPLHNILKIRIRNNKY